MNLGLVFKSGDAVLIGVFLCLIAMSITTWVLILLRGVRYRAARRANRVAMEAIWAAKDLTQAEQQAKQIDAPIRLWMQFAPINNSTQRKALCCRQVCRAMLTWNAKCATASAKF